MSGFMLLLALPLIGMGITAILWVLATTFTRLIESW